MALWDRFKSSIEDRKADSSKAGIAAIGSAFAPVALAVIGSGTGLIVAPEPVPSGAVGAVVEGFTDVDVVIEVQSGTDTVDFIFWVYDGTDWFKVLGSEVNYDAASDGGGTLKVVLASPFVLKGWLRLAIQILAETDDTTISCTPNGGV